MATIEELFLEVGRLKGAFEQVVKERDYLRDKHSRCVHDAIDGQAALDEANNRITEGENREEDLRTAAKNLSTEMAYCIEQFQALGRTTGGLERRKRELDNLLTRKTESHKA